MPELEVPSLRSRNPKRSPASMSLVTRNAISGPIVWRGPSAIFSYTYCPSTHPPCARVVPALAYCLCGIVIPLPFFPEWAQPVLNALPFRHLVDTPFRLYLGHIPPQHAPAIFAQEAFWAVALVLLGRWVLARGARKLVAQGG